MQKTLATTLAAALLIVAQGAFAHDPAEHAKEAEQANKEANCAAFKDMDHSRMPMPTTAPKKPDAHEGH